MRSDSGTTQGLLKPERSENTNLTTTHVSHTGSSVNKPVRKMRCSEGRCGSEEGSADMLLL